MSLIAYMLTWLNASAWLIPGWKKSLTMQTPCSAFASWCSIPELWPVHRCSRLMMSCSITSGGIPG